MRPVFIHVQLKPSGNADINIFAIASVIRQGVDTIINTTDGKTFTTSMPVPNILTAIANAH